MVTESEVALQEIANGTIHKFWKLVLKQGAKLDKNQNVLLLGSCCRNGEYRIH
jgi:hypothetical protein